MNKPKIAIINTAFGKTFPEQLESLKAFSMPKIIDLSQDNMLEKLKPYDAIIAGTAPNYPKEIIEGLSNLKIISRMGTGYDNLDLEAAKENNISLTRVPGEILANTVSELTVGMIISALRQIPIAYKAVQDHNWDKRKEIFGGNLKNKTVGLIGYGNIAKKVAKVLLAMEAKVIVYTRTPKEEENIQFVDFEELLKTSDIISLHCPYNEKTHHLISEKEINLIKNSAIIVNTGRGALVNEAEISKALNSDNLGIYITDVLEKEPIVKNHIFYTTKNCMVLPHLGGSTKETLHNMGESVIATLRDFFLENKIKKENLLVTNEKITIC